MHGLFADGSCWSEVIPRLQAAGLNVTSVQNPLTTLEEAVASAQRVLARQDGPTVLVGHSFSGMIVTEAGVDPKVSAVVYIAARAPDAGEDYGALAQKFPTPPASAGIVFDGDEGRLTEEAFLRDFAGDLPEAKAKVLYAVQEPFHKALLTGKTTHAAWRSKPSFYAVSTEDRTINPDLERFMAKRMGAKTIEVKASHLALISQPDAIASAHSGGGGAEVVPCQGREAPLTYLLRAPGNPGSISSCMDGGHVCRPISRVYCDDDASNARTTKTMQGGITMSRMASSQLRACATCASTAAAAQPADPSKYPNWKGQWQLILARNVGGQNIRFDPTKAWGRAQQAPLTPEYQKVHEDSMADQAKGGLGNYPDRQMSAERHAADDGAAAARIRHHAGHHLRPARHLAGSAAHLHRRAQLADRRRSVL